MDLRLPAGYPEGYEIEQKGHDLSRDDGRNGHDGFAHARTRSVCVQLRPNEEV